MDALRDHFDNQIRERVKEFRSSLSNHPSRTMVHRYVLNGDCFALNHSQHMQLKEEVAEYFNIASMEAVVVGSAKLGFSISPRKQFRPFSDRSDIDVAIASPHLFNRIWGECLEHYRRGAADWELVSDFQDYLFRGWIRPDKMPSRETFALAQDWWEFFRSLSASDDYGRIKVTGALYRSWEDLEYYQCRSIDRCRKDELEESI